MTNAATQSNSSAFRITPDLRSYERKVYSQFGEDGIIERLAADLQIASGTFFEFGIGPADGISFETMPLEGMFVLLREKGWRGIFLDGHPGIQPALGVSREFITPLNINLLFRKYELPLDLDMMSIDVDGQDFWIWMAFDYLPKVLIIEYNGGLGADVSVTTQFEPDRVWDGTCYHGASYAALVKLGTSKGYTPVYANGVNLFFVRTNLVANSEDFDASRQFVGWEPHKSDLHDRPWIAV